jgi:hypothetical protein
MIGPAVLLHPCIWHSSFIIHYGTLPRLRLYIVSDISPCIRNSHEISAVAGWARLIWWWQKQDLFACRANLYRILNIKRSGKAFRMHRWPGDAVDANVSPTTSAMDQPRLWPLWRFALHAPWTVWCQFERPLDSSKNTKHRLVVRHHIEW